MLLKIYGTDKEKERAVNLLRENKIAFDFPSNITKSVDKGTLMLFGESCKGTSKFETINIDNPISSKRINIKDFLIDDYPTTNEDLDS